MHRVGWYLDLHYNVEGPGFGSMDVFFSEKPKIEEILEVIEKKVIDRIPSSDKWNEDGKIVLLYVYQVYSEDPDTIPNSRMISNHSLYLKQHYSESYTPSELMPHFPKIRLRYITCQRKEKKTP